MSVDYSKLKTNLNLIMHRLKLVVKKKIELNQKARRTIGEFLTAGKVDRARIRVEQIIREDYLVEAMDLVESYCDFILSRFGQLQSSEVVDEGLATAISSLVWITPRLESDVPELKVIADQLGRKYGKQYVMAARENQLKTVNETLMKKMGTDPPAKILVEKYLVEIAKDQKIDYKPDPRILKEQEVLNSSGFRPTISSDEDDEGGRRQAGQAPQGGFNLIDLGDHYPRNPITAPFNPYGQPPPLPSEPPLGPTPTGPMDMSSLLENSDASAPAAQIPIGFNVPSMINSGALSNTSTDQRLSEKMASATKRNNDRGSAPNSGPNSEGPPPNYDSVVNKGQSGTNQTQYFSFGPDSSYAPKNDINDDILPELPPVPIDVTDGPSSSSAINHPSTSLDDRIDFDDLTRRFEELKNKKD